MRYLNKRVNIHTKKKTLLSEADFCDCIKSVHAHAHARAYVHAHDVIFRH